MFYVSLSVAEFNILSLGSYLCDNEFEPKSSEHIRYIDSSLRNIEIFLPVEKDGEPQSLRYPRVMDFNAIFIYMVYFLYTRDYIVIQWAIYSHLIPLRGKLST